jgi:formylglycine-generating enzyme required for sulfatase activity
MKPQDTASMPMPRGLCSRVDLLRSQMQGDALGEATARLLGFEPVEPEVKPPAGAKPQPAKPDTQGKPPRPPEPQLWYPASYAPRDEYAQKSPEPQAEPVAWVRARHPPRTEPLSPWRELRTRLRSFLCVVQEGRGVDTEALVRRLSRGRQIDVIPRPRHRRWAPTLQVIVDRSEHLVPYWNDQEGLLARLSSLLPPGTLEVHLFYEGLTEPLPLFASEDAEAYQPPSPGGIVLVLGDLGCLAGVSGDDNPWLVLGRRLHTAGCQPVALLPCALSRCAMSLQALWTILPWERSRLAGPTGDPDTLLTDQFPADLLMTLAAPAIRIEPGLLRGLRGLLPMGRSDAGLEADVWQHPAVISTHSDAATLDPEQANSFRGGFEQLSDGLKAKVLWLLRDWRRALPQEIWFEEIRSLASGTRELLPFREEAALAERFFVYLSQQARDSTPRASSTSLRSWYRRCIRRLSASAYEGPTGEALHRLSALWAPDDPAAGRRPGYDPVFTPAQDERTFDLQISQRDQWLVCARVGDPSAPVFGSPLGRISTGNGQVQVIAPPDHAFWETGEPPPWADAWGWDKFGAWVEFAVAGQDGQQVIQRMRWIEPGTFLMGSPEDELERYSTEGPQHPVRIEQGFWLFDTAVTQALWEAVMGTNPSHLRGPDRPVEQVSWQDCQDFIARVNALRPGLALALPSEAQWEYACRAGTDTPFSFGANITPEQVNYRGNHPYAGGEKGLFRGETVPVASLPANAWGLYEMHGNVREWVQDAWHDNYVVAPSNEDAWESADPGQLRVLRGGGWFSNGRSARSSQRNRGVPGYRSDLYGFRLARGQGHEPGRQELGAERVSLARPGPRSGTGRAAPGSSRAAAGAAPSRQGGQDPVCTDSLLVASTEAYLHSLEGSTLLRLGAGESEAIATFPASLALLIRTDREQLLCRQLTRPAWASAMGRDRYGLWAEIAVEPKQGEPIIQRLRWIPPGRFQMGSPKDEPGRWEGEGPRHPVTLTEGYWLFDTPCTQALWATVMGTNPSRFKSPDRPVEQVSWDAAQGFIERINARLPGLALTLPSEAQWEYACRADTEQALYTGAIEILGDANAPALDPIAWYGGNSGVDFELDNGLERTWLSEMQHPQGRAGTHPVKRKQANPWGLYDMLGNVWEWTEDTWHESYAGAPTDGSPWEPNQTGAGRVVRGGSWYDGARSCRSAYRLRSAPVYRFVYLGFRCTRVQA